MTFDGSGAVATIHRADPGRPDGIPVGQVGAAEPEGLLEDLQGTVARAVVDHHDFEPGIVAVDEVGDAVNDGHLFVERRHDHGERLGVVAAVDEIEVLDEVSGHAPPDLAGGEQDQQQEVAVVEQEVAEEHRLKNQSDGRGDDGELFAHQAECLASGGSRQAASMRPTRSRTAQMGSLRMTV